VRLFVMRITQESGPRIGSVNLLDPASLARQPSSPNRFAIVLLGLMVGLTLGALWQWMTVPKKVNSGRVG
jgi:uncharacterized protein involved in exopolysaccharide biosynthesis